MSRQLVRVGISLTAVAVAIVGAFGMSRGAEGPPTRIAPPVDSAIWKTFRWRSVGPDRGGRSLTMAGVRGQPKIAYFGATGGGLCKSTDAGKTWTHVGFKNSDAIAKIRVHPTNPDIVFVADFGKYGVDSEERGLYKTSDGGKTWRKVLDRGPKTGAVDI